GKRPPHGGAPRQGTLGRRPQRRQGRDHEGKHAPDGGCEQGLRALRLVRATPHRLTRGQRRLAPFRFVDARRNNAKAWILILFIAIVGRSPSSVRPDKSACARRTPSSSAAALWARSLSISLPALASARSRSSIVTSSSVRTCNGRRSTTSSTPHAPRPKSK